MKLVIDGDLMSVNPVLPVRWCLAKAETEILKNHDAKNIHILFVIAYENTDLEDRLLVPVDQMMAYLNLRRPGKHTVFAKLVWTDNSRRGQGILLLLVQKQSHRSYDRRLLDISRDLISDAYFFENHSVNVLPHTEKIEVVVPKEHFPPEPAEWWKKIVNFGYSYPPIDQCQFRKRTAALPLTLPFIGVMAIAATILKIAVALFLSLCGMRRINFKAILHPFGNEIGDVCEDVDGDNSWFEKDADGRRRSSKFIYVFHPLIYLGLFGLVTFVGWNWEMSYGELLRGTLELFLEIWGILFSSWKLAGLVILLLVSAFVLFNKLVERRLQADASPFHDLEEKRKRARYDDLYKLLACRTGMSAELSAIPAKQRTFHLRYLNIKAKICRPFAAS